MARKRHGQCAFGYRYPAGPTLFFEEITLSPDGKHYTGRFTLDAYDPLGNQVAHVVGRIVENGSLCTRLSAIYSEQYHDHIEAGGCRRVSSGRPHVIFHEFEVRACFPSSRLRRHLTVIKT